MRHTVSTIVKMTGGQIHLPLATDPGVFPVACYG